MELVRDLWLFPRNVFDIETLGRYWLENLLRNLTYISPFDHDSAIIVKAWVDSIQGNRSIVSFALEDLMYYRLGKGWSKTKSMSWFLDQAQLAKRFGKRCTTACRQ